MKVNPVLLQNNQGNQSIKQNKPSNLSFGKVQNGFVKGVILEQLYSIQKEGESLQGASSEKFQKWAEMLEQEGKKIFNQYNLDEKVDISLNIYTDKIIGGSKQVNADVTVRPTQPKSTTLSSFGYNFSDQNPGFHDNKQGDVYRATVNTVNDVLK